MTIQNAFEFANAQELRRRLQATIDTGKRKLTGSEYEQWEPSIQRKVQEIDNAVDDFFVRMAFGSQQTTCTMIYAKYMSSASTTVRVHANVFFGGQTTNNLLTGVLPETISPYLPFAG
jgi:hypothetical protein